jgi:hypothetical protein
MAVLLLTGGAAYPGEAAERQTLRHRFRAAPGTVVERLPATNRLHGSLCLPLRNPVGLTNLLVRLYDPSSPDYRRYLSPAEFTARFGPTAEDYVAVVAYVESQGLQVTTRHPNRTLVDFSGTAAAIEKAFATRLQRYHHPREKRLFHAPATPPSIPLAVPVLSIAGLDNFAQPRPTGLHRKKPAAAPAPLAGSGPQGNLMGYDFRKAYAPDVTRTGTGQIVGLLQFDGYYAADIEAYRQQAGLPAVTLEKILVNGFSGTPGINNLEVAMDIEMVISMAPGLERILVYETSPYDTAISILNRMATDNRAKQLSASWSWGTLDEGTDQVFQQFAAQGQTYFNASGDDNAYTGFVDAPCDNPYITLVGGTTLTTDGAGNWSAEVVWNWGNGTGSGGGTSTTYPIPSWQSGISMTANHGSTTRRNIPDVAMAADNIWVIFDNGDTGAFGGTSAAAPLWAGFMALVNEEAAARGSPPIGFLNPYLYAIGASTRYTAAFHDVTRGHNASSSRPTARYQAVPGYDLCTGWGSPTGQALIETLATMPTLTVRSDHGRPSPGTTLVVADTTHTQSILDASVTLGTTQYVCAGATVTGNTFTQSSPHTITLVLTNSATLAWLWQTNYWLKITTNGKGTVTGGGWHPNGATATLTATPRRTSRFIGWSGQTNGCLITSNILHAPLAAPRAVTAIFSNGAIPILSGTIRQAGTRNRLENIALIACNGSVTNGTTLTDSNGCYTLAVPYGWSGTLTPVAAAGTFSPAGRSYRNLRSRKTVNFKWYPPPVSAATITRSAVRTPAASAQPPPLLHSYGTAVWSGPAAWQAQQAPELLSIHASVDTTEATLPPPMPAPDYLTVTTTLSPALQAALTTNIEPVLVLLPTPDRIAAETPVPNATTLGEITFRPVGNTMVLQWDLLVNGERH